MNRKPQKPPVIRKGQNKPAKLIPKKQPIEKQKDLANYIAEKHPRHPKAPKRSEAQKAADLEFFEHWHIRGKSERQLAKMIAEIRPYTLCRQQINQDLKKLRERWQESALVKRTDAIARELAGLDAQEDELWQAWEKSKHEAMTKTEESFTTAGKGKSKRSKKINRQRITTEAQCGEASFQKLIGDIQIQRRQLLGLDAPAKVQPVGDDWMPQEFLIGLTKTELPEPAAK
jgi:hypothetical protein